MANKCCFSREAHISDTPMVILITAEQEIFVITTWELQHDLSLSLFLSIYLTPLIIPLAVVSFDYETKRGPWRPLSRAFVCLLDPRCVVRHPTALLHPAAVGLRGTMAHYIMEYGRAIYQGSVAAMLHTTPGVAKEALSFRTHRSGTFGDCITRNFSCDTIFGALSLLFPLVAATSNYGVKNEKSCEFFPCHIHYN